MALMGPGPGGLEAGQSQGQLRREEARDYFQKWLEQDVVYIISDEERYVFAQLTTPEEKEQFIEQFWVRRDPDPSTAENEFKAEHYRRIAYANEWFTSGRAGWKTDRGRVYILWGPPDQVFKRPAGGTYDRPMHEGGGTTAVFPFEQWNYHYLEGIGEDVELEFVDPTYSGEYRLALRPEEKDALLHIPGAGLTLAEEMGLAGKRERPFFSPGRRETYPLQDLRAKDNPFARYETYQLVQAAPVSKYPDLRERVHVEVGFQQLPFRVAEQYFRLGGERVLAPVTLELQNQDLTFQPEAGVHVARLAVYGLVRTLTNRVVAEFEDDMVTSIPDGDLQQGLSRRSVYQKTLVLERGRYKLDLVVKDLHSGMVGVQRRGLVPPQAVPGRLAISPLLLADALEPLAEIPSGDERFVLGDVKVLPNVAARFPRGRPWGLYFEVYGAGLDQSTGRPALEIRYQLDGPEGALLEQVDDAGKSIHYASAERLVLMRVFSPAHWPAGRCRLTVTVQDRVTGQSVSASESLEIER